MILACSEIGINYAIALRETFLHFTSIRSSHMNYFIYFTWCTYISDVDKLALHSMDSTTENHHIGCNSENVFCMVQCNLFPNTLYIGKPNDKWKTVWHARPKPTAVSGLFLLMIIPLKTLHGFHSNKFTLIVTVYRKLAREAFLVDMRSQSWTSRHE